MSPRLATLAMLAASLVLAACDDAPRSAVPRAAPPDPRRVILAADFGAEIKVNPARIAALSDTQRVAGKVDFDAQRVSRIGATVTGRVIEVHARPGQPVKVGEALAAINSTELGAAQLTYLKARAQAELQSRSVERARQLFAADVIGQAELQRRESELAIAAAEQRGAADQLRVLGIAPAAIARLGHSGTINSVSAVTATLAGTVVERHVALGQVVQPADSLYVVADLSRVWVSAEIPEQQAGQVRVGQSVDIEVPALGSRHRGTLIFVADTVNPDSRTISVRSAVDNPRRLLKPAMLATMLIHTAPVDRVVVPAEAVVRDGDSDHVFVANGPGDFRLTAVQLGPDIDGKRAVHSGLQAGQPIVVTGAFHLNNERKRKELE